MKPIGSLLLDSFLETVYDLRDKGYQCVFKDLCGYPKLLDLLLHLRDVHVLVDVGEAAQEGEHSIVVYYVNLHQSLELVTCLLLGMLASEFREDRQQVLFENEQVLRGGDVCRCQH